MSKAEGVRSLPRKRIYEIAKELGVTSKELIAKLDDMGMPGMKAANSVDEEDYALIVHLHREEGAAAEPIPKTTPVEAKEKPKRVGEPCPPIVSVLGHIDHGKTTLLDAIRRSRLVSKEAGGITQEIGAYQAEFHGKRITFIDTPGHKAFTGMRARGAQATDIAILVVAADDGVMAQTVEAIDHIKAARIPMIVAINKVDKPNADVTKVMNDLAKQGLTPESWGGDVVTVEISALQNQHIDDLLEMILLVAEMEDLRADVNGPLRAVVIESQLTSGRGPVATAVVKGGTLREKDWIVAGSVCGRVKALIDPTGSRVRQATPGQAVEILGFNDVPAVGTEVSVHKSQAQARRAAEQSADKKRPRQVVRPVNLDEFLEQVEGEQQKLQLVLKAATTGALEGVRREIDALAEVDVELEILHVGVGGISESDVLLAASVSGDCLVVGFGVKADAKACRLAEHEGVLLLTYDVIYDLVGDVERALRQRLSPELREVEVGLAEVRDTFKVPSGIVAGCYVTEGKVTRNGRVRVLRNGEEVYSGEIVSLRRFEDDVREVLAERECGIRLKDFDDVQIGDRLLVFTFEEVAR